MSIEPISINRMISKIESSLDDPGESCTEQVKAAVSFIVDEVNIRIAELERKIIRR